MHRLDKGAWGNWIEKGWSMDQVVISDHDREILRDLAKQFRELCERPIEQEKIKLWTDHNDLKETRPLILVDMENGWNEALRFDRDITCEGYMAQDWEMWLRKEIMYGTQIKDDKPLTPVFYLPYRGVNTEWGINEDHEGSGDINQAYSWKPKFADLEDEEFEELDVDAAIEDPYIKVDWETSNAYFNLAKEVFDGILDVQFRTWWFWSSHMVLAYSHLRGLDGMMIDFYEYPEKVHEIFQKLTTGYINKLKQIEREGVLYNNVGNTFVGSGGLGWSSQLHPDPKNVKLKDIWGLCEAQEATGISPWLYKEFIFPYFKQVSELFGLNCYACCEGVDPYWEDIKQLHNMRRISVSQWADAQKMSDYLGKDYVYSYKARSTDVACENMSEEKIHQTMANILDITKNKNNLEIVLKDLHTIGNKPEQVFKWVEIVREEINKRY